MIVAAVFQFFVSAVVFVFCLGFNGAMAAGWVSIANWSLAALAAVSIVHSFAAASHCAKLYKRKYEETWKLLGETSLIWTIGHDEYRFYLQERLDRAKLIKLVGRSGINRIEEHLKFCAYHRDSLLAVGGHRGLPAWELYREESARRGVWLFSFETFAYWVLWFIALLTAGIGIFTILLSLAITTGGPRFIAGQAALAALCVYIMQDDPRDDALLQGSSPGV